MRALFFAVILFPLLMAAQTDSIMQRLGPGTAPYKMAQLMENIPGDAWRWKATAIEYDHIRLFIKCSGMSFTARVSQGCRDNELPDVAVTVFNPALGADAQTFTTTVETLLLQLATVRKMSTTDKEKITRIAKSIPFFISESKDGSFKSFFALFVRPDVKNAGPLFQQYAASGMKEPSGTPRIAFRLSDRQYFSVCWYTWDDPKDERGKTLTFILSSRLEYAKPLADCCNNGKWEAWPCVNL